MYDKKKKFRRSAVTIICYVLAALMLIYTCYQIGNTIHTINEYYAQYGMKATPVEYLTYIVQSALTPLINAAVLFMLAVIHNEVRKNNPANYQSDEEIVEAGIAKKEARDEKKFEKGEKAAAKAGHATASEEPVVADFTTEEVKTAAEETPAKKTAEDASAEKPEAKKPAAKKTASGKSTAKKPAAKKTAADGKDEPKKSTAKKAAPKRKSAPKKAEAEKQEKPEEQEKPEKTEE